MYNLPSSLHTQWPENGSFYIIELTNDFKYNMPFLHSIFHLFTTTGGTQERQSSQTLLKIARYPVSPGLVEKSRQEKGKSPTKSRLEWLKASIIISVGEYCHQVKALPDET